MRSQHHHHYTSLHGWHANQRQQRRGSRWIPYSLRWKGGIFVKILPQILFSGTVALALCAASHFKGHQLSMHTPILFPAFGFIVGLAISFRMHASYNRWCDGRIQWERLSTLSRSFARTVWIHIPGTAEPTIDEGDLREGQQLAIQCSHMLALALKHHLRDERDWDTCAQLKNLLKFLPDYPYLNTNHPITITVYMGCYIEHARLTTNMDPQVYTHLLAQVEGLTAVVSACERLLRTPIPLGYNIVISRIVWIFVLGLPTQIWRELHWWSVPVTMLTAYTLFALAEVGLEIENPWGDGPNDLDLDRYCNLLALDLEEIVSGRYPQDGWFGVASNCNTPGTMTPMTGIKSNPMLVV
ncbi:hypothetical protein VTL71DRAFT_5432 [Oculimacula yallundae]|uniref:Uncharacterized protein n=1 Tax=Oculimacula yallundae TaxID=86028 RepID=A0ABR4C1P6_9HELO